MNLRSSRYLKWAWELLTRAEVAEGPRRKSLLKEAGEALDASLQFAGGEEYASDDIKAAIEIERMQIEELREENDE